MNRFGIVPLALALWACGPAPAAPDASTRLDASSPADAARPADSGPPADAGLSPRTDAGPPPPSDGGPPPPSDAGLPPSTDGGSAEIAALCDTLCVRIGACFGGGSPAPECTAMCQADLLDCSAAQLETLRGCSTASCEPPPGGTMPELVLCIGGAGCTDSGG